MTSVARLASEAEASTVDDEDGRRYVRFDSIRIDTSTGQTHWMLNGNVELTSKLPSVVHYGDTILLGPFGGLYGLVEIAKQV